MGIFNCMEMYNLCCFQYCRRCAPQLVSSTKLTHSRTLRRISAFRAILIWQNFSVVSCTAACYTLLVLRESAGGKVLTLDSEFFQDPFTTYLLIFIHVMGASSQIASKGSSVSIEKDWVPEISKVSRPLFVPPSSRCQKGL